MPTKGNPRRTVRFSHTTIARLAEVAEDEGVHESDIIRRGTEKELGITPEEPKT